MQQHGNRHVVRQVGDEHGGVSGQVGDLHGIRIHDRERPVGNAALTRGLRQALGEAVIDLDRRHTGPGLEDRKGE